MAKHTLCALVENRPGVLMRVVNLFRRRNFNIDSLTVGRTHRDDYSRITMVMEGSREQAELVEKNLYKLVNVIEVEYMSGLPTVERDLALIKVQVDAAARRDITQLCDIFRARIVDVSADSMIVETTGEEAKIESFCELLRPFGIVEMVRTGIVAMGRGDHNLRDHGYQPQVALAGARKSVL
ncbi:MAG: acetolactate synthase small subunit [Acidobacteria bacterium]|nr:MAG: acetolactate synthase small subunit [Acidobacteriota bacterium]REK09253.1 MAG: acetolactate synthase small subunit [Acidobacteriota bacterium]